tara:strand:- start:934 stop:1176 length:243 start_codon:yes stop_codon:yes gene_type:complete
MKFIEFGNNPFRFIGLSYVKRMYALRADPRPMLTIHLLFFVMWIKLPWEDVANKEAAAKVISYGGVVGFSPLYFRLNRGN